MATETFANFPATTVPAGADGNPGTETWTVSSSDGFPTAATGVTQFHVADTNQAASSELILVTNMSGAGNNTWTVTRGAEGTTPVAHQPGFTVTAVITAGWLNGVSGSTLPEGSPGALLYASPADSAAWLPGPTSGKQFLTSTGSGGTANTPAWGAIAAGDVPVLNQNTTGTAATAGNVTGVVAVPNGGTGDASVTAYAVVTGGTAATSPLQHVASVGTAGQVLTSGGSGTLPSWQSAPVDWLNVVTGYGADPSGSADSTAAIQAAINAAQQKVVFFPSGTYNITSPLTMNSNIRLTGDSVSGANGASDIKGSIIVNAAGGIIADNFTSRNGVEMDHLTLEATGGHIITAFHVAASNFHHLRMIQNSATYGIWDHDGSQSNAQSFGNTFRDIYLVVHGTARTVPAWAYYNCADETIGGCLWDNINVNNKDGDASQYIFSVLTNTTDSGAKQSHLVWNSCQFAEMCGGAISLSNIQASTIFACSFDGYSGLHPGVSSPIFITSSGGSNLTTSKGISIIGCTRETVQLTGAGTTWWDIEVNPSAPVAIQDIRIDGYNLGATVGNAPYINVGNASNVVITGCPANTNYYNQAGDTVIVGGASPVTVATYPVVHNSDNPSLNGMTIWNADPAGINGGTLSVSGVQYMFRLDVKRTVTPTAAYWYHTAAGAGATSSQNYVGVYNSGGTLIGSASIDSKVTSSGAVSQAITLPAMTPGTYYGALLWNAGTCPTIAKFSGTVGQINQNVSGATIRFGTNGTAQTTMGSTVTLSSNTSTNANPYFFGLG